MSRSFFSEPLAFLYPGSKAAVRNAAAALSAGNVSLSMVSRQMFSSGSNLCSRFERKGVLFPLSYGMT
jgi:hypothetical protein